MISSISHKQQTSCIRILTKHNISLHIYKVFLWHKIDIDFFTCIAYKHYALARFNIKITQNTSSHLQLKIFARKSFASQQGEINLCKALRFKTVIYLNWDKVAIFAKTNNVSAKYNLPPQLNIISWWYILMWLHSVKPGT